MRPKFFRPALALLLGISCGCRSNNAPIAPPSTQPIADDARTTLTYLASDELEGRGVGTHGLDLAADFIAHRFQSLGLRTLPALNGYFQPFSYRYGSKLLPQTQLAIDDRPLAIEEDFEPMSVSAEGSFSGPLVFVGYGISDPENIHYDDYANIDVKGKIAVAMRFEPRDSRGLSLFTHGPWSGNATLFSKAEAAAKHGAVGLLLVNPPSAPLPRATSEPASLPTAPATQRADVLLHYANGGGASPIPVCQINERDLDAVLIKAQLGPLTSIERQIETRQSPDSFLIPDSTARGNVALQIKIAEVKNVIAVLPGHGPHADEFILIGAHYDHLGRGMLGSLVPGSHEIHHGADDNASGTTTVMELAAQLTRGGRLDRSIIFATFTAEEEGLIGSDYFVKHPPVPLDKIVGMINFDMVGRPRSEVIFVGGSGTAPTFDVMLKTADAHSPLDLKFVGPIINQGGMGPSDQQSFAVKKVPVLFFFTGLHADYHTPTDTSDKINYSGIAQIVAFGQTLVDEMATMPKQQYVSKFDSGGGAMHSGPTLGVIPDYSAGNSITGVRISGTRPGTPAADAGLREGDVIVEIGDTKVGSIYDLSDALSRAKSGETVKIVVLRDQKQLELHATFRDTPG